MRAKKYMKLLAIPALVALVVFASASAVANNPADNGGSEAEALQIAKDFVRQSPTFTFDGIEKSLQLLETHYLDTEDAWRFVFHFESRHAGYGDRTDQIVAQVITPHETIVTIKDGEVKSAIMDNKWDMINQQMFDDVEIKLAPIDAVEVIILDTLPPQVGVYIKGGLRDGCTTFHDTVITQEGNTIYIEVTTQRPKDATCIQIYTYFEASLDLGSDFPAGTYTLKVNDYVTTFEILCSLAASSNGCSVVSEPPEEATTAGLAVVNMVQGIGAVAPDHMDEQELTYQFALQNNGIAPVHIEQIEPLLTSDIVARVLNEDLTVMVDRVIEPGGYLTIEGAFQFGTSGLSKQDIRDMGHLITCIRVSITSVLEVPKWEIR